MNTDVNKPRIPMLNGGDQSAPLKSCNGLEIEKKVLPSSSYKVSDVKRQELLIDWYSFSERRHLAISRRHQFMRPNSFASGGHAQSHHQFGSSGLGHHGRPRNFFWSFQFRTFLDVLAENSAESSIS